MRPVDPSKAPRIIQAASQLFAERSYREVRMDDIANRAGVAKGTLYLHFRDKEALYLSLIEHGMDRHLFDVISRLATAGEPVARLRTIINVAVSFFDKFPYFLELLPMLDAKIPDSDAPRLSNRKLHFTKIIRETLDELSRSGGFHVVDTEFSALSLIGLIHEVLRSTSRPWPEFLVDRIEHQFLYGVRGSLS